MSAGSALRIIGGESMPRGFASALFDSYYSLLAAEQDRAVRYEEFRREYTAGGLTRQMLNACPLRQFELWLEQSVQAGLEDPTAMAS